MRGEMNMCATRDETQRRRHRRVKQRGECGKMMRLGMGGSFDATIFSALFCHPDGMVDGGAASLLPDVLKPFIYGDGRLRGDCAWK